MKLFFVLPEDSYSHAVSTIPKHPDDASNNNPWSEATISVQTNRTSHGQNQNEAAHTSYEIPIPVPEMPIEGNHFGIRKHLVEYEDVNSNQL